MKVEEEVREGREIALGNELANEGVIRRWIGQERFERDDPRLIDFSAPDGFVAVAEMKANVTDQGSIIAGSTCLHQMVQRHGFLTRLRT